MTSSDPTVNLNSAIDHALDLAASGDDDAATQGLLKILSAAPTHFRALNELGTLALSRGFRSAARTSYRQAAACHPGNATGRVNLANVLLEDGELAEARRERLAQEAEYAAAVRGWDAFCRLKATPARGSTGGGALPAMLSRIRPPEASAPRFPCCCWPRRRSATCTRNNGSTTASSP